MFFSLFYLDSQGKNQSKILFRSLGASLFPTEASFSSTVTVITLLLLVFINVYTAPFLLLALSMQKEDLSAKTPCLFTNVEG